MRAIAGITGVLGGGCWIARLFVDPESTSDTLFLAGFVLVSLMAFCTSEITVPRAPAWLKAVVGVGSVLLTGSVVFAIHSENDSELGDAILGGVFVVASLLTLTTGRSQKSSSRAHGSHSR